MAIVPNENYNGKTRLKDWWKIVRDNFKAIFAAYNTHRDAAELDHPDGSVRAKHIADGAVGTAQLAKGAVNNVRIANNAVDARVIQDEAVTALKIKNDEIGDEKLQYITVVDEITDNGPGGAPGIGQRRGKPLSLLTSLYRKMAEHISGFAGHRAGIPLDHPNESVTTEKIAAGAVGTAQLAVGAVNHFILADSAVETKAIKNNAVTSEKLASGAVTLGKLGADAITALIDGKAEAKEYYIEDLDRCRGTGLYRVVKKNGDGFPEGETEGYMTVWHGNGLEFMQMLYCGDEGQNYRVYIRHAYDENDQTQFTGWKRIDVLPNERYVYCDGNNDELKINKAIDELDAMVSDGAMRTIHLVGRCVLQINDNMHPIPCNPDNFYYSIIKTTKNMVFDGQYCSDIIFDASTAGKHEYTSDGILTSEGRSCYLFSGEENVTLKNCSFTQINSEDLMFFPGAMIGQKNCHVEDCVFHDMYTQAAAGMDGFIYLKALDKSEGGSVRRCRFERNKIYFDASNKVLIRCNYGSVEDNYVSDISVTKQYFLLSQAMPQVNLISGNPNIVRKNYISNLKAIGDVAVDYTVNSGAANQNGILSENVFENICAVEGEMPVSFYAGVTSRGKIENNTFYNIVPNERYLISLGMRGKCSGNFISNIKGVKNGATIISSTKNTLISNNHIYTVRGESSDTVFYGISGTSSDLRICNNTLFDLVNAVPIQAPGANSMVIGNVTDSATIGAISGDGTIQANNVAKPVSAV